MHDCNKLLTETTSSCTQTRDQCYRRVVGAFGTITVWRFKVASAKRRRDLSQNSRGCAGVDRVDWIAITGTVMVLYPGGRSTRCCCCYTAAAIRSKQWRVSGVTIVAFQLIMQHSFKAILKVIAYFGLCFFCIRVTLSKVFGRPLRTMSLYNCNLLCVLINCI